MKRGASGRPPVRPCLSELRRLRRVLDALPFLVAYIDAGSRYRFLNRAFEAKSWFDAPRETLLGRTVRECIGDEEFEAIRPYVERVLSGETVHYQIESVYAESAVSHREATYVPDIDPRTGAVRGYVAYVQDVSAQRQIEDRLRWLALHDHLTGLPNRAYLRERMDELLAEAMREGSSLAVLYLDLDGFKDVNDTCGHDAGDEVLQAMSHRLSVALRRGEFVARLGGDEFAILVPKIGDSARLAENVRRFEQVVTGQIDVRGYAYALRASIGVALFPDDGADALSLVSAADRAMYAAKRAYKG